MSNALASLNPDAFLKLFITQLKHQDPTQPMDASKMTAELAQLSMVQKLDQLHSSFQAILNAEKLGVARDLIGSEVTYLTDNELSIGVVEAAVVENGTVGLLVNGGFVPLDDVNGIFEISAI